MKRKSHAQAILEILRRERRKRPATTCASNDKSREDGATTDGARRDEAPATDASDR
jgi:hypothetical protein